MFAFVSEQPVTPFHLQPTVSTPEVRIDEVRGELAIIGPSFPDEAHSFYHPVLDRVLHYMKHPAPQTLLEFNLNYLNVESSKALLDILNVFRPCVGLRVVWYHADERDAVRQTGEHLSELSGIPFEYRRR